MRASEPVAKREPQGSSSNETALSQGDVDHEEASVMSARSGSPQHLIGRSLAGPHEGDLGLRLCPSPRAWRQRIFETATHEEAGTRARMSFQDAEAASLLAWIAMRSA